MKKEFRQLKDLNLVDDFLFGKLAQEAGNEEIIKELIETLLGQTIPDIVECQKQHAIDTEPEHHGVRLDVYVKDADGKIYDVEVQVEPRFSLPKRMRYYQGLMDAEQMPSGEFNYAKLPENIIIFICDFDPYDKGWYRYQFKNLCISDPLLEFGDETQKIVLNTKGKVTEGVSPELIELLGYFRNSSDEQASQTESPLVTKMNRLVNEIKNTPKFGGEFMLMQEKLYHIREEGREEGREEERTEMAKAMLNDNFDMRLIMKYTGLSNKEVQHLANNEEE